MTAPAPTEAAFATTTGFDRREPREVAATIARLLAAPEAFDPPPSWLLEHQIRPFRRAVAALRAHGGAILTLPVGTGKTYVALAVGQAVGGGPIAVVAPAILADQWNRVARLLGLAISFRSHEAMSRGHAAPAGALVVIDESHRFRTPTTRRYRTLAPQLTGRWTLLLTATPVVNRLADLGAQLRLATRDDTLRLEGVPSLTEALAAGQAPAALNRLVISGQRPATGIPLRRPTRIVDWGRDDADLEMVVRAVDRLRLAREPAIAALIRTSFYRALASSPAALIAGLRRYRRLLAHAADARRGGHRLNRAAIRAVIGADPDQLVWWELLEARSAPVDLAIGDLEALVRLERRLAARQAADGKAGHLLALLADPIPTIVFVTAVETVRALRDRLAGTAVGWLTGQRAGIGPLRASRAAVLRGFGPSDLPRGGRPIRLLLATDVAAEGLDLQRAGRIVHYDLPWTSIRLEQRDGRAIRAGSDHAAVEVVRFAVPALLEARLALEAAIDRKRGLPARVGLAADTAQQVGVGDRLLVRWSEPAGVGWGAGTGAAAVAGFTLADGTGRTGALILGRIGSADWSTDPGVVERALELATDPAGEDRALHPAAPPATCPTCERAGTVTPPPAVLRSLDEPVSRALADLNGRAVFSDPVPGRVLAVVRAAASDCRRDRKAAALQDWSETLRFLGRGHTAGEAALIDRVAAGQAAGPEATGPVEGADLVTATLVALIC